MKSNLLNLFLNKNFLLQKDPRKDFLRFAAPIISKRLTYHLHNGALFLSHSHTHNEDGQKEESEKEREKEEFKEIARKWTHIAAEKEGWGKWVVN